MWCCASHQAAILFPLVSYLLDMEGHASSEMLNEKNDSYYRWNEDKCIQLIRKFRSKSILWDTNNPLFYKQQEKKRVWDNIGRDLNTTGANCKHKMTVLLSSFRREKSKFKNSILTGTPHKSSWFGFNHLAFLMNRHSGTHLSENIDDDTDIANEKSASSPTNEEISFIVTEDDSMTDMKRELLSDEDEELERDLGIDSIQTYSPVPARQDTEPDTLQHMTSEQNIERSQRIQIKSMEQEDLNKVEEIATFTKFIQAKMQKYSPEMLYTVQKQICEILFEADRNYCAHSTNDDNTKGFTTKKRKLSETLSHRKTQN